MRRGLLRATVVLLAAWNGEAFLRADASAAMKANNVSNFADSGCSLDSDCSADEMCVFVSEAWSQCIACDDNFQYSCPYWDDDVVVAAEKACQMNCPGTKCDDIVAPCYGVTSCVHTADGTWSQCVDCSSPSFQNSCVVWDTDMRSAAVEYCEVNCLNTRCSTDATTGMPCVDGYTCVVQADNNWSQCIDCSDTSQFKTDCFSWTTSFKKAAEETCGLTCP